MSQSTGRPRSRKAAGRPKKPYHDFPLTPHASGAWMKKIRGKIHYFGKWGRRVNGKLVRIEGDGWKEALELYKAQADDLHAGRTPRLWDGALTVANLCNRFLTAKLRKKEAGELGARMFAEYKEITDLIVAAFGGTQLVEDLAADDFEDLRARMARRWGPVRLGNAITRVKSVFKYGIANALIEKAVRYGSEFEKPDKTVLRRHRARNGGQMLEAADLRRVLDALAGKEVTTGGTDKGTGEPEKVKLEADPVLLAMVLLGINCGYGNHDVASLPLSALDLECGWVSYARPKTGIPRRSPLWPETIQALKDVLAERPEPKDLDAAELVFLTSRGRPCLNGALANPVGTPFRDLLRTLGLHRAGVGFYVLRRSFRTAADAACDNAAIDLIMGHSDRTMGGHHRVRVEDSRLVAVVEVVRKWLWPAAADKPGELETLASPSDVTEGPGIGLESPE